MRDERITNSSIGRQAVDLVRGLTFHQPYIACEVRGLGTGLKPENEYFFIAGCSLEGYTNRDVGGSVLA